ncbi:MAG: NAD+ synthase [Acidobacteria bacterium]|nr:NAD+ synthase [Acidobacteriota bacterium]
MPILRVAIAQMNSVVGSLSENVATLQRMRTRAAAYGATLVVTPELALTGYPPEDLLLKEGFVDASRVALEELALASDVPVTLVGTVLAESREMNLGPSSDGRDIARRMDGSHEAAHVANVVTVVGPDGVGPSIAKQYLPNYDVFDEQRYFHAGQRPGPLLNIDGIAVGVVICEDIWVSPGPAHALSGEGASVLLVPNASPYARGRQREREEMLAERARETGCAIVYCNLVGGQDELVFDGQSVVVDAQGRVVARADAFTEELLLVDLDLPASSRGVVVSTVYVRPETEWSTPTPHLSEPLTDVAEVYEALVMGTRDYLRKNGFREALVALSGGIDSSLVAAIAVDAVGARAVRGFALPSRYSSEGSRSDAYELAMRLDIEISTLDIDAAHRVFEEILTPALGESPRGLTDENLQSRIRGVLMMALSNASGAIVLTTGNKSEMATGYSTLYGDSAGGFAVIKDVPKTLVYDLCRYVNERALHRGDPAPIPDTVLEKPPSAELRPDQRDDQSLPPYELLDPLLALYVEQDWTASEMVAAGYDPDLVRRITRLVDRSEYKRRQMPPGVRITKKAFGRDRRMPITNGFYEDQW